MTARPCASSPRWRRCRIRASRGSFRRSSRISASASTCRTATPPRARSRPRRKPAPPIRSSTSRYWISIAGYQVREGANEPRVTVPLNDNIDYEGGVVTWIDNLAGDRPYGNDLDPTLNLDILEVSFPQSFALEDHRDAAAAGDGASHHRLPEAVGRKRRVHQSALAYLLFAGALLAPISAVATPPSSRCRRRRGRRSIPTERSLSSATGCWPMCRPN